MSLNVTLTKRDLINLLRGTDLTIEVSERMQKAGYMRYSGNQHEVEWKWHVDTLLKCTENQLWDLYIYIRL